MKASLLLAMYIKANHLRFLMQTLVVADCMFQKDFLGKIIFMNSQQMTF
jgi:hypothetical protein